MMKKWCMAVFLLVVVFGCMGCMEKKEAENSKEAVPAVSGKPVSVADVGKGAPAPVAEKAAPVVEKEPELLYGIVVDDRKVKKSVIKRGENLTTILKSCGVSYRSIYTLADKSRDVFDVRHFRSGRPYAVISENGTAGKPLYFVYEKTLTDYVVFGLNDGHKIYEGKKRVTLKKKELNGVVKASLYEALVDSGGSPLLSSQLEEIFAWQVDFFRIQEGDSFKIVYDEKYVEGKMAGVGKIRAVCFQHWGRKYYAFLFENGGKSAYFDEDGNSMRKTFLKAPLKYSRITSRYNPKRFHPVLKRVKPHLGTDYAAPVGTPIYAVGDGSVTRATYSKTNGNYVKIRHNSVYQTQYLHMSRIAKGIRPGVKVIQGQVIGYVGSTGMATGPHLCFRFWKNGRQVDPLKDKFPSVAPVKDELKNAYDVVRTEMMARLETKASRES